MDLLAKTTSYYTVQGGDAAALGALAGMGATMMIVMSLISIAVSVLMIISMWKIFTKAGREGWASLIPIYNIIVMIQVAELPLWYIALLLVPLVNIYAVFKIYIELAKKFGKSTGFGVAMVFFSIICMPILAFSKDVVYLGNNPKASGMNNGGATPNGGNDQSAQFAQPIQPTDSNPMMQQPIQPAQPQQPIDNNPQNPINPTPSF